MTGSLKKLRKTKQDFQVKQRRRVPPLVPGSQPLPPHGIMDADSDACCPTLCPVPAVPCACCLDMCSSRCDTPATVTEDEDVYDCGSPPGPPPGASPRMTLGESLLPFYLRRAKQLLVPAVASA
jgi:hypothetical protein